MKSRQIVFDIHRLKDEGYSTRKIAGLLSVGRNTVIRYLKHPEKVFKARKKSISKLDTHKPFILECLDKDPTVCAPVILEKIKNQGFKGGITILRDYLKQTRGRTKVKKAFIRFEADPGQEIQIDWGHFGAIDYGNTKRKPNSCRTGKKSQTQTVAKQGNRYVCLTGRRVQTISGGTAQLQPAFEETGFKSA